MELRRGNEAIPGNSWRETDLSDVDAAAERWGYRPTNEQCNCALYWCNANELPEQQRCEGNGAELPTIPLSSFDPTSFRGWAQGGNYAPTAVLWRRWHGDRKELRDYVSIRGRVAASRSCSKAATKNGLPDR